jgi:hypothetical protein
LAATNTTPAAANATRKADALNGLPAYDMR